LETIIIIEIPKSKQILEAKIHEIRPLTLFLNVLEVISTKSYSPNLDYAIKIPGWDGWQRGVVKGKGMNIPARLPI
jgi:hypothetical protein